MTRHSITMPEIFSINEASEFKEHTYAIIKSAPTSFQLDFQYCKYIDSTGLGVLIGLYKKCQEYHGEMTLIHLSPNVENIFQMTRLNQVFTII